MKFGFIGAGIVAQTIARHLLAVGHTVVLSNSRGPDTLTEVVSSLGEGASAGTAQQAADQEVVVLSVGWVNVLPALASVPDWAGRILIDATNRIEGDDLTDLGDLSGTTSSEIIAEHTPGAKVVKAFNTTPMSWISSPSRDEAKTVLFVSGDDVEAKELVSEVLAEIGFAAVDLGTLAVGGRLQQLGGPLAGLKLTLVDWLAP